MKFDEIEIDTAVLEKYLDRGLVFGTGDPEGQVGTEAAICLATGLPIFGYPRCVAGAALAFSNTLSSAPWSSPAARSTGLRKLIYAQLGTSKGFDPVQFSSKVVDLTVREILPQSLRRMGLWDEATRCESVGAPAAEAAWAAASRAWLARTAPAGTEKQGKEAAEVAAVAAASARRAALCEARQAIDAAREAAMVAQKVWQVRGLDNDAVLLLSADIGLRALAEQGFFPDKSNRDPHAAETGAEET